MAEALRAEFEERNEKFSELFKNQDFKGISNLFTKDCWLMPFGQEATTGREAVEKAIALEYEKGHVSIKVTLHDVVPGGEEYATDRNSYAFYNKDGDECEKGKSVTLRRKENGVWYYHYDIFNLDTA